MQNWIVSFTSILTLVHIQGLKHLTVWPCLGDIQITVILRLEKVMERLERVRQHLFAKQFKNKKKASQQLLFSIP